MAFPTDRRNWKVPRRRAIKADEYDAIMAAVKAEPGEVDAIAQRFGLSVVTVEKLAKRVRRG